VDQEAEVDQEAVMDLEVVMDLVIKEVKEASREELK